MAVLAGACALALAAPAPSGAAPDGRWEDCPQANPDPNRNLSVAPNTTWCQREAARRARACSSAKSSDRVERCWQLCPQARPGVSGGLVDSGWCRTQAEQRYRSCGAATTGDRASWCQTYGSERRATKDPKEAVGPGGIVRSPSCSKNINKANCSRSGMVGVPHELTHYGIDNWVDVDIGDPGSWIASAIQSVNALLWSAFIQALTWVLVGLEWAFNLQLTETAMPDLARALLDIHKNVLGNPWTLAAISVAGLWGIYNGLVRQRTIQTLGGLMATVLLMAVGLYVIHKPDETVGEFSRMSNDGALGVLGLGAAGTTENPDQSFAGASEKLFVQLALHPWCALEFGSVEYCYRQDPSGEKKVMERWLEHPAWSEKRHDLFDEYSDSEKLEDRRAVFFQAGDGAIPRNALLLMIALGLIGAICLLFYLALRLILAGVMTLFLTLATPFIMLAPAFGEAGRKAFGTWAKRLAGALVTKLIYTVFLAVVIFVANIIAAMEGLGFGGRWLLFIVFWWGVFFKRKQLVGFVEGEQAAQSPFRLMNAYFGYRAVKDIGGSVVRTATYVPRKTLKGVGKAGGWAYDKGRERVGQYQHDNEEARDEVARDALKDHLRGRAEHQAHQARQWAGNVLAEDTAWKNYDQQLRDYQQGRTKNFPVAPGNPANRPTEVQVRRAGSIASKHPSSGRISITDSDIERWVQEHGTAADQRAWEQAQKPGLDKVTIDFVSARPGFDDDVREERQRIHREQKRERKRKGMYRRAA